MRSLKLVALLLFVGTSAAACASGKAQVIEDRPTLSVPPVPARTIEPQPAAELPPVEPIPESNPTPSASPKPKPAARNNAESRAADPKPDTAEATTAASTPPPAPVAPLRSSSTPSGPDALRQVRDTITRAEGILSRVDYQKLSQDRRATYDGAKNFISQAEEKIKQEDFTLALSFAQRAENIAKTLLDGVR
jgi:hypothetical protein